MNILPIIFREFYVLSRRPLVYLLRTALVGFVLSVWYYFASQETDGSYLLLNLTLAAHLVFGTTAAVLASDAISSERRNRTLGILKLTPLKPSELILGKLLSGSTPFVLCLIAIAPIFSLSLLKGGLEWPVVLIQLLDVFALVFLALAIGLFYSTFCLQPIFSVVLSLMTLVVCYFGVKDVIYGTELSVFNLVHFFHFDQFLSEWQWRTLDNLRSGYNNLGEIGLSFGLGVLFFASSLIAFRVVWLAESNPGFFLLRCRPISSPRIIPLNRRSLRFEDNLNPLVKLSWNPCPHLIRRLFVSVPTGCCLFFIFVVFLYPGMFFLSYTGLFLLELSIRLYASLETPKLTFDLRDSKWLDLLLTVPKCQRLLIPGVLTTLKRSHQGMVNALILCHVLLAAIMVSLLAKETGNDANIGKVLLWHLGFCFLAPYEIRSLHACGTWVGLSFQGRLVAFASLFFLFCLIPVCGMISNSIHYYGSHSVSVFWINLWFVIRLSVAALGYSLAKNGSKDIRQNLSRG